MKQIYFEVPTSTNKTRVCIPHGDEELWIFVIDFFEFEHLDLRKVVISGDFREDGKKEVQSLSAPMLGYDSNEFEFEFEITKNESIVIEIAEWDTWRNICVTY